LYFPKKQQKILRKIKYSYHAQTTVSPSTKAKIFDATAVADIFDGRRIYFRRPSHEVRKAGLHDEYYYYDDKNSQERQQK
jgi:hypothetical protein